ncbi:MAG: 50S ribosomal protein L18 [Nitrospirae bacterium RBG_13_39_12]|nr:MAG: 50S ribosomal protein L18 [Nitrospirae bacterium RBG_13_39_12]
MAESRKSGKNRRHKRIRKKVSGSSERLRLSVYRSLNHIYAQIIDDFKGETVAAASSLDKEIKNLKSHKGNKKTAKLVGELIAKRALEKGIKKIVFDRSGYLYHGSVKELAEAVREVGLEG